MYIKRANVQGFCFGVAITVKKAEEALFEYDRVTTLGNVVHNPQTVEDLARKGLRDETSLANVASGALFVRAHGLPIETLATAKAQGLTIVDATCPMVSKIHAQVEKLQRDGYQIVVVGDSEHAELKATLSHAPRAWCIRSIDEVAELPEAHRIGVVVQSTFSNERFSQIVKKLAARYDEVRAINTICTDTKNRQAEAVNLAADADVVIVVGGKSSANTKHLAELAESNGARAFHIEGPHELQPEWFAGVRTAGLMSGASTPGWLVDDVSARIEAIAATSNEAGCP